MLKLMKYEFRKTRFAKLVLLGITLIAEIAYLLGVFCKWDKGLGFGIVGLALCAVVGIMYIGIDSLIVFHRDLNTKQSYMLFLTPKNSYQVLGAKVLENGISIFLTGVFYAAVAAVDMTVAILYIGGLKDFLDILQELSIRISLEIDITPEHMLMVFFMVLASWLLMLVIGDLAIVLCSTVLAGKRFSGVVSFLAFLVLGSLAGKILDFLPVLPNENAYFCLVVGASFAMAAVVYVLTGWIMERKLSV